MIVWLASYPRSGNTLLRTVLYQTMGCESYNEEIDPEVRHRIGFADGLEDEFGHRELPRPWPAFCDEASASKETFFVKTHRVPRDDQPAIYVVRDGRSALLSYSRFHRKFHGARAKSLLQLVVGDDFYGEWSQHYASWTSRPRASTLVVRFEELADAPAPLLESMAAVARPARPIRPWRNPFARMNESNPRFFAAGKKAWEHDTEWTPFVDGAFFCLHGDLMRELGYATDEEVTAARGVLDEGEAELAALARRLARERRETDAVCAERQEVIDGLKKACDERLALIQALSAR